MNRNKIFVISIIVTVAANAVVFGFWFYIFSKISHEKAVVQNLREEMEITEKRLKNSRSLSILLKDIKNEEEKISAMFLNSKNLVDLIEDFEFIGEKSGAGLTIRAVKLPESPNSEKPKIELQIKGPFLNIFYYLSLFENLP